MRAWATAACLVLVAASAFYLRQGTGGPSPSVIGDGVMRSQALELVAPVGDIRQAPVEFRWRAVAAAVRYASSSVMGSGPGPDGTNDGYV